MAKRKLPVTCISHRAPHSQPPRARTGRTLRNPINWVQSPKPHGRGQDTALFLQQNYASGQGEGAGEGGPETAHCGLKGWPCAALMNVRTGTWVTDRMAVTLSRNTRGLHPDEPGACVQQLWGRKDFSDRLWFKGSGRLTQRNSVRTSRLHYLISSFQRSHSNKHRVGLVRRWS